MQAQKREVGYPDHGVFQQRRIALCSFGPIPAIEDYKHGHFVEEVRQKHEDEIRKPESKGVKEYTIQWLP